MALMVEGSTPSKIVVYGASGMCVQIALDLRYQAGSSAEFAGYVSDVDVPGGVDGDYPIFSFDELRELDDVGVVVLVSDPEGRRSIFTRLAEAGIPVVGASGAAHLVHPEAQLGEGTFVVSTARVGHNTRIGRGSQVLSLAIAHDVTIGDFCTFAIATVVSGQVIVGDNVFVGAGAIIQNGSTDRPLVIGEGAIIGAGAIVDRSVEPGAVMVSPRAMPLADWKALRNTVDSRYR